MNIGELSVWITADISKLTVGLSKAAAQVKTFSAKMESTLKANAAQIQQMGRSARMAGLLVTGSIGLMVKGYGNFERAMRVATAVSDVTATQFKKMGEMAETEAVRLNMAATKTAEAFYFLGSAGLSAADQMKAFVPVAALSKAATLEMGAAAEMVVDTMKGFKIAFEDTAHVTDVMAKAVTSSNMTFAQLGKTMSMVAGVAKMTNNTIEETAAMIATMADVGIKGTRAGTSLRRSLLNLAAPTSDIRDLMEKYNIAIYDANGAMKPFIQLVGEISPKLRAASEEQRNYAFKTMFGARAIAGQLAVFDKGVVSLRAFTKELERAGGTAEEIAAKQMVAFSEGVGQLIKQVKELTRHFVEGFIPVLEMVSEKIKENVGEMKAWVEVHKTLAAGLATMVGTAGLLLTIIGQLAVSLGGLTLVAMGLNVSFGILIVSAGGLVIGLTALASIIAGIAINVATAKKAIKDFKVEIKNLNKDIRDSLRDWKEYWRIFEQYEATRNTAIQIQTIRQELQKLNKMTERVETGGRADILQVLRKFGHEATLAERYFWIPIDVLRQQAMELIKIHEGVLAVKLRREKNSMARILKLHRETEKAKARETEGHIIDWQKIETEMLYEAGRLSLDETIKISKQKADAALEIFLAGVRTMNEKEKIEAHKNYMELEMIYEGHLEEKERLQKESLDRQMENLRLQIAEEWRIRDAGQRSIVAARDAIFIAQGDTELERSIRQARVRYDNEIAAFIGSEEQKAEYRMLRERQLTMEISKIKKDALEKETVKVNEHYRDMGTAIQGAMSRSLQVMAEGSTTMMDNLANFVTEIHNVFKRIIADLIAQWMVFQVMTKFVPGGAAMAAAGGIVDPFAGFAKGGLVTKPTLALIGEKEPEAVIPLSKMQEQPVTVNLTVNAIDAQSTAAFFQKNQSLVAATIQQAMTSNSPLRRFDK